MSHSHEYKCRSIGFSVDGRQLRAYRRSLDRKASRDEEIMKRRSLVVPEQSELEKKSAEFSLREKRNSAVREKDIEQNFNTLTPVREVAEISSTKNTPIPPPSKKMTGSDLRRLQLLKYKEQKLLKQQFQKQSKPAFKVCRVNHTYNAFPVTAEQRTAVSNHNRVTRSMVKKMATKETEEVVPVKVYTNPKKTEIRQKRVNNSAGTSQRNKVITKTKSTKEVQAEAMKKKSGSFAPVGFQFTAPDNLYYQFKEFETKADVSESVPPTMTISSHLVAKENINIWSPPQTARAKLAIATPVAVEIKSILKNSPNQTHDKDATKDLKINVENVYKTPAALTSSVKKTRFILPHEETGISPLVTTTRGSSSKRKDKKFTPSADDISLLFSDEEVKSLLQDIEKADVSRQCEKQSVSSEKDPELVSALNNFKNLVSSQREDFLAKIDDWSKTKSTDQDIPTKVIDDIDCTIGMADLLMNQRFKQFEELIHDCEFEIGEKKTTIEDLRGFWDMVEFQVKDVKDRFTALEILKDSNWYTKTPSPVQKKRPTRKTAVKASKQNKSSSIRQHIAAARKKKMLSELENTSTKETKQQEASNNTPIYTPIATATRRRSRLSAIFTEQKEETKLQCSPVTRSAARRSASLGYLLVPTAMPDPKTSSVVEVKKIRRSVRFLNKETDKENSENSITYRATPYRQRQRRRSTASCESSDTLLSESILFVDKEQLTSNCTQEMDMLSLSTRSAKKLRKPSLLPMGNCTNTVDLSGDLMSFSPLEEKVTAVDAKSGTVATPLRRSMRSSKKNNSVKAF